MLHWVKDYIQKGRIMKKHTIIPILAVISIIFIIKSGIIYSFAIFLLVGVVPGTTYVVPSNIMLLIISAIAWIVLLRFTAIEIFYTYAHKRSAKQHIERKKRMPQRRFSEI